MTVNIRPALTSDHQELERIRVAAFTPIFESFRSILGDKIYELAQKAEDEEQAGLLLSMFNNPCVWTLFVAEYENVLIGFIAIQSNQGTKVGEIGLNAIDPKH
ncbi:MAG: hypothetical protein AB8B79_06450 [Granulosicoccus sp.]